MGLFKKKNNQKEEAAAAAASAADPREGIKKMVLDGLNAKLNGTLYDD